SHPNLSEPGNLLTYPAVNGCAGLVARRDGFGSLQRVIDLEVIARLFVEVVNLNRDARLGIIGRHVVVHRDRCGRHPGIRRHVERLEDGPPDHSGLDGFLPCRLRLICRRNNHSEVVTEITVLDCYRTIATALFRPLRMRKWTRYANTQSLNVG